MKKRNYFYKYTCVLLTLGALLSALVGCGVEAMPDYRTTPFKAELRYEMYGTVITAEMRAGSIEGDTGSGRDIELYFTSPPELSGLCVRKAGGEISMIRGDTAVPISDNEAALYSLAAAELMTCEGELCKVEKIEENGVAMRRAVISAQRGDIDLFCDVAGVPKRITDGKLSVTVIRFQAE